MISCLLIQVSHNPHGLPIRKESAVSGDSLQIGRGAACKIHLPDHRVYLHHATIKRSEDGALYIEGEKDVVLNINGTIEQGAALSPGTRIEIGPYELVVGPVPEGHDLALSVEMIQSLAEHTSANRAPLTLAELGLSKRRLGFGLAALILFAFLLLPLLPSVSPALDKWQADLPLTLTGSWNAGPLSSGHNLFGEKCSTCHRRPFLAVTDDVCTGCHKNVAHHLADNELHASVFKNVSCTECHPDHKGKAGLVLNDSSRCVACHGNIKARDSKTSLADVHGFDTDHPQFRVSLLQDKKTVRVRQDEKDKLVEHSGLKYSHKVHLAKGGVSTPGGDTVMVCQDCHKLDNAGERFLPMTMHQTCQQSGCHKLYYEKPADGVVPHGSEREAMGRLREFFVRWLAESPANMASCERTGDTPVKRALDCASKLARENAGASLFNKKNVGCGECHEIVEKPDDGEVPWKVTPLRINRNWHATSIFPHAKHVATECTACHDKMNSKISADVSMPPIEKCRECHAGDHPAKDKVASTCDSCHRFHGGGDVAKK